MINGKITEPGELIESLKTLKRSNPRLFEEVTLIVDGNSVVTKKLSVPNLKRSQYHQLVREDMSDTAENYENIVFDYSFLEAGVKPKKEKMPKIAKVPKGTKPAKKLDTIAPIEAVGKKSNAIFACATDKLTIESYQSVFDEAKIKLAGISVGLEAVITFVRKNKELAGKTFVLNLVDGFSMLSIIFEKGSYIFSTRTRLIGEGNEQFLLNVLENLSPLIQFNKSQHYSDIETSYYLGLSYAQVEFIAKMSVHNGVDIRVLDIYKNAKKGRKVGDRCYFAFLGAMLDRKNINLIRSYKNIAKFMKDKKHTNALVIVPIALAVILLAVAGRPVWLTMQLNSDISVLDEYLNSKVVVDKSAELDAITNDTNKFGVIIRQIEGEDAENSAKPIVGSEILDLITKSNSLTIQTTEFSFDEAAGIIHVIGSSATQNDSSDYVSVLKRSELVDDVYYTGYSYDNGEIPRFNFAVDVVLHTLQAEQTEGSGEE